MKEVLNASEDQIREPLSNDVTRGRNTYFQVHLEDRKSAVI
jgi:hypothetical protein